MAASKYLFYNYFNTLISLFKYLSFYYLILITNNHFPILYRNDPIINKELGYIFSIYKRTVTPFISPYYLTTTSKYNQKKIASTKSAISIQRLTIWLVVLFTSIIISIFFYI